MTYVSGLDTCPTVQVHLLFFCLELAESSARFTRLEWHSRRYFLRGIESIKNGFHTHCRVSLQWLPPPENDAACLQRQPLNPIPKQVTFLRPFSERFQLCGSVFDRRSVVFRLLCGWLVPRFSGISAREQRVLLSILESSNCEKTVKWCLNG